MVALVTNPWSNLLLVIGMEVKAWPGVEMLCLGDPSAHSRDLDIWCLIAVQTALSELTSFLPGEKQPSSGSVPRETPASALARATTWGQHLTCLCPLPQWR